MRIGCLQFAPRVGDIDNNLNRADAVLNRADPDNLDLLVLPELAFSGYNFKSLQEISPYLEHSGSGISSLWARTVALKYDCTVIVGYPEKVDLSNKWPASPEYYNSAIVVNGDGETVANCRKSHLFNNDEKWALENPHGFFGGHLVGLGQTAIGICMDLNPYQFQAPWEDFEFAHHVLEVDANLVVITMAWMTHEEARMYSRLSQEPDLETLMYWVTRLDPVIRRESEDEIIVVLANRTGSEDNAMYTGTSAIVGIKEGEVRVYGVLGRGEKDLLVVDTELAPFAKLVQRQSKGQLIGNHEPAAPVSKATEFRPRNDLPATSFSKEKPKEVEKSQSSPKRDTTEVSPQRSSKSRESRSSKSSKSNKSKTKKKLAIDTSPATISPVTPDSGNIRTPTCPSPTPHAIRPRLVIPPTESLTAKYVEAQHQIQAEAKGLYLDTAVSATPKVHADTPHPLVPRAHAPIQIFGGDVTISKDGTTPSASPSAPSMSHFSDASPAEPKLFWAAPTANGDFGRWWHTRDVTPATRSDGTNFSEDGSFRSTNISPVVTHRAYPVTKPAAAQLNPRLPPGLPTFSKPETVSPPETIQEVAEPSTEEQRVGRPASPKSRNASRSRGPDRPGSAVDPSMDMGHITKKLDEIAQRVSSAQGKGTPTQGHKFSAQPRAGQRAPTEAEAEAFEALNLSQPSLSNPMRRYGRVWDGSDEHRSSSLPNAADQDKKPEDNFLASSFQSRTRARSNSDRGRATERPGSRASMRPQQMSNINHARTVSRGRQPNTSQDIPPNTENQSNVRSSNRSRPAQAVEPIDLSQFALIEEYPSANCPVHGSRPGSKARNHSSNGDRRMPSIGPPRGSPPTRRPNTSDPIAKAVEKPLRPIGYPFTLSSDTINNNIVTLLDNPSTCSPSPKSPREPRTPKAMALVYEGDNSSIPELTLKCLDRTAVVDLSRPKSAVL